MDMFTLTRALAALLVLGLTTPAIGQSLFIENTTVIDGTGAEPRTGLDVVVVDGRVATIAKTGTKNPGTAKRVDGSGKFLIPGLMDVHIHLPGSAARNRDGKVIRPENRALGVRTLHSFLYSGVTTVYDASNNAEYIFSVRAQEQAGEILSPRIFATGGAVSFPGSWGAGPNAIIIDSWPAGRTGLDRNFDGGPDLQKITYENFGTGANPWVPTFSDDLVVKIIKYAEEKGVRTTIHTSDEHHARIALAAGVDTFAHPVTVGRMSDDFVTLMVDSGVVVASTLGVFENIVNIAERPEFMDNPLFQAVYTADQIEEIKNSSPRYTSLGWGSWFKTTLKYSTENVKRLHDAGVFVALGTDRTIGPLTQRELQLYVESGISPLDAITMGTLNAAKYLDREEDLGSIEPGKLADMVLLDANPLLDIRNTQRIAAVFKGGVEVDREALLIPGNRNN